MTRGPSPAAHTWACSRCGQQCNGSQSAMPQGWRVVRARLLCDDCLGARRQTATCSARHPRYSEVRALVIGAQKASVSFVQRTLLMHYADAARCMEQLEAEGVVSKPANTGRRTVLLDNLRQKDLAA